MEDVIELVDSSSPHGASLESVTLSHFWGQKESIKTERKTLQDLMSVI